MNATRRVLHEGSPVDLFGVLWTVYAPMTFCDHTFSSHDLRDFMLRFHGRPRGNNLMDMDNPETVKDGDWIFVEQGNLSMFLSYMFPRIEARFVLVTTGSHIQVWDHPTSWTGRCVPPTLQRALESPKVLLWITKNAFV